MHGTIQTFFESTSGSDMFESLSSREETVNLVNVIKYLLYEYTGDQAFAVEGFTLEDLKELYTPSSFNFVNLKGDIGKEFTKAWENNTLRKYVNGDIGYNEDVAKYINEEKTNYRVYEKDGIKYVGFGIRTTYFEEEYNEGDEIAKDIVEDAFDSIYQECKKEIEGNIPNEENLSYAQKVCLIDIEYANLEAGIDWEEFFKKDEEDKKQFIEDNSRGNRASVSLYENEIYYLPGGERLDPSQYSNGELLAVAGEIWQIVCETNPDYGGMGNVPPNNLTTIDCSSFVTWVLYELGYTDFEGHQQSSYSFYNRDWTSSYSWEEIYFEEKQDITSLIQPGDIVVRRGNNKGHVAIVYEVKENGDVYAYDCGSKSNWENCDGEPIMKNNFFKRKRLIRTNDSKRKNNKNTTIIQKYSIGGLMKLIKRLVIILIVLLILILLTIMILDKKQIRDEEMQSITEEGGDFVEYPETIGFVTNENKYYSVNDSINTFLEEVYSLKQTEKKEETKQKILNMLDKAYISEKGITLKNIEEKLINVEETPNYEILKIYVLQEEIIDTYFVTGKLKDLNNLDYIVRFDKMNNAFSIEPTLQIETNMQNVEEYKNSNRIENVKDNNIIIYNLTNEEICRKYFIDYKKKIQEDIDLAYSMLDEEYTNAKFENVKDFEKYIENIKAKNSTLKAYDVKRYNNEKKYICQDQYDNYYVFNVTSAFEYTVYLDLYTVDLPETKEQYLLATEQEKVAINIQKIITAINQKDYMYVYNKLSEEFKKQNFRTVESLKIYIQNNFFEKNNVEYIEFSQIQDIYTYSIKLYGENNMQKEKTFIMQLNSEMDFEMSFNID